MRKTEDLIRAALHGDTATVQALIDVGIDVNAKYEEGWTALMAAVQEGHPDTVEVLLAAGADANLRNNTGATALIVAATTSYLGSLRTLLRWGADPNVSTVDNWTALMWAAQEGHTDAVQALLDRGADPNAKSKDGWTALILAASRGHIQIVQALLSQGADANANAQSGSTALIVAAENGHTEIVQDLLVAGADVNAKMLNGVTALILAAQQGHTEIVQTLLDQGADLNAAGNEGWTALMAASQMGHIKTVQALLSRGADVNARAQDKRTALIIAAARGHTELVELLKLAGSNYIAIEAVLPALERRPLITKLSLFIERLPTFFLDEDTFLSSVNVNPPNTLFEDADEAMDLHGELIAYVNQNPMIAIRKIRLMADEERQGFFDRESASRQWGTFFGSTSSGLRYSVLAEYDEGEFIRRRFGHYEGLADSNLKKETVDWAELEQLPNREAAIEPLMREFRCHSGMNGSTLCKFLGEIGSEACRKPLLEILDYARCSKDEWDQEYLIGAACANLLKLPGKVTALRTTATPELFRFVVARALMALGVEDEERTEVSALLMEDERQSIAAELISFFRSAEDKAGWLLYGSKALSSLEDNAFEPLLEIFRTVKQSVLEDDGSVGIEGDDGASAAALVRIPGGIKKLKEVCSLDEYERILVRAHNYGDSSNPDLINALGELATAKAIGRLRHTLFQSHWKAETRKPAKEALVKLGQKAHAELLGALAWPMSNDRKSRTCFRREILDVLKETGDEQCVLTVRTVMESDPLVSEEARATHEAISKRCENIEVPVAVQAKPLPLKIITKTGDAYVDACFQIEFQEFYDDRDWFEMPEAKAIPRVATEEALRLAEVLREKYPDFYFSYYWFNILYRRQGRYDDARNIIIEGLRTAKSKFSLCERMAETEWQAANLPEAVKWWIKSIVVQVGTDHLDDYVSFLYLSYIAEGLGLFVAATSLRTYADRVREGIRVTDELANKFYTAAANQGTESMGLAINLLYTAYLDAKSNYLDVFLSMVTQSFSDSPEAARSALSLVLQRKAAKAEADALTTQRATMLGRRYPEVALTLQAITTLRERIANKTLASVGKEGVQTHRLFLAKWHAQIEQLKTELRRLEAEAARQVPELNVQQQFRSIDQQVIAMALPAGATLIEFFRFDDFNFKAVPARGEPQWKPGRYLAFVITSEEPETVEMIDLGEAEPIDKMIATFRSMITGEEDSSSRGLGALPLARDVTREDVGIQLREAVFTPILKAIGNRKRLLISPDGELTQLPVEVLPTDDGGRLIDEYRISYLTAGRDVVRFDFKSDRKPGRPLVVANPDFDLRAKGMHTENTAKAGRLSRDFKREATKTFERLLGTKLEGEKIAAMLDAELWTDSRALDALLKKCQSPRILHISTHGFFLEDQKCHPNEEPFRFASTGFEEIGMDRLASSHLENPLLRSGLALAGVNTWLEKGELMEEAEDGLLTAEDVSGLDLLDTDLVVLPACDTGRGEVRNGEGVLGLRSAFVLAGAKTLVMSLWKVPDEQTRQLMEDFYRRILAGQSRVNALREAQLAMKAKHPDPLYWGAFICQGDPNPMTFCAKI